MEEILVIFVRKILRSIYGRTRENEIWRMKNNTELCDTHKEKSVIRVDDIKSEVGEIYAEDGRETDVEENIRWIILQH